MATDGLSVWSIKEQADGSSTVYLGNPEADGTEVLWIGPGPTRRLVELHNREVEWSRVTLLAEKAAGRPTLSAAEIEAALTRIAVSVAVEVAKSVGPIKVVKWAFRALRRRSPRPPAVSPLPTRSAPPPAA